MACQERRARLWDGFFLQKLQSGERLLETHKEEEAWLNEARASFSGSSGQRQGSGFKNSVWCGERGFCFMFSEGLGQRVPDMK